ncbi:hypothetical protein [Mycolicibacter virginiensis]|uniref:hypothetical protein n=1 Tax=Mycolicibacter virginiensis TaxID=1795032 RepID=UPI0010571769|nr:hypothetical protein [Mycolicibacter virginiensis]ULP47342.1 hypothetical protein MJO54_21750 [Mycolicibacter virginiensis]
MSAYTIPLPPGADPKWIDAWEVVDGVPLRQVWSEPIPVPAKFGVDVRVVCTQTGDGRIVTDDPDEAVAIHWCDTGYSPAIARAVAAAISKAADLAELWAGQR